MSPGHLLGSKEMFKKKTTHTAGMMTSYHDGATPK